jgi:hypothetical protein
LAQAALVAPPLSSVSSISRTKSSICFGTTLCARFTPSRIGGWAMAKVVCVLYDDPVSGYPKSYPRDGLPKIEKYPDGQTLPTPEGIDFTPGTLLGSVSGELGLRKYLESHGHQLCCHLEQGRRQLHVLDKELVPMPTVVISQPFWPAYITAERFAKAPKLKLAITAGIGSDHTDLQAAMDQRRHRCGGHLLQQHQRGRAHCDDDPRRWCAITSPRTSG